LYTGRCHGKAPAAQWVMGQSYCTASIQRAEQFRCSSKAPVAGSTTSTLMPSLARQTAAVIPHAPPPAIRTRRTLSSGSGRWSSHTARARASIDARTI